MIRIIHRLANNAPQALAGFLFIALVQSAAAQDFVWAPDFPVGSTLPAISAQDQDGDTQNFDSLKGEKGMLFMLSRSFDW